MSTQIAVLAESASLWYKDIRSDKTYSISLVDCDTGWTVTVSYGRRGSTQVTENKIERGSYDDAKRIYDQTLRSKLAKGYRQIDAPVSTPTIHRAASREVVFSPELLTRITATEAKLYARNDRYGFQQKRDGDRLAAFVQNGRPLGYNKLGQITQLDSGLNSALQTFCRTAGISGLFLDGEWESTGYWVWDLLEYDMLDLRERPYKERQQMLSKLFPADSMIHSVPIAWTTDEKIALWVKLEEIRAEGFAVKDSKAPYRGGRNGAHLKFKFEQVASFFVGPKPKQDGHRSVGLWMFDQGRKRYMASVKIADKYDIPTGVIDVRYLYLFPAPGGHVYQPVYFGVERSDVKPEQCLVEQLKLKGDD